ncbi:MAG: 1,4-dihydroxy-6-naphthoate synthase [Deltaproteobacteria bacterium]|nr:1,4-dihydroxy-6-naphthoate synthase [Deltaproteobacteria bacterium]
MNRPLTLGYSTCPNDTFIFYALAHNLIDCGRLEFKTELKDIETLNQYAKKGIFDISKLSFAAMGHLQKTYGLLRSGAALGRGCGPLVVAKPGYELTTGDLESKKAAIPGMWTTAAMLLGLHLSDISADKPKLFPMSFDQIMPAVSKGEFEFGVIIHEGRFTYQKYGLVSLVDLGQWWEEKTSLPIPLGGIAIRRDISPEIARTVESVINASVTYAFNNKQAADGYIKKYAQEMDPSVIRQHIDLYVNEFTIALGREGEEAIKTFFAMAKNCKLIPESNTPLFAC